MDIIKFISTTGDHSIGFFLRLTLFIVIFPHGCQQLLGWFGGYGFSGTMSYFTDTIGLPWVVGLLVILLQFFGPLFLLAGLATKFFAFSMIPLFIGMIASGHLEHGLFMNWSGKQAGEGFEYHLLVIGIAIALVVGGAGRFSLDAWVTNKYQAAPDNQAALATK